MRAKLESDRSGARVCLGAADVDGALARLRLGTRPVEVRLATQAVLAAVRARLVRAARYEGLSPEDAEDVAQAKLARLSSVSGAASTRDVLVALQACPVGKANALVWTIGVRAAADYRDRKVIETPTPELERAEQESSPSGSDEDVERMWSALEEITDEQRDVLLTHYFRGRTDDDAVVTELGRAARDLAEAAVVRLRIQQRRSRAKAAARASIEAAGGRRTVSAARR